MPSPPNSPPRRPEILLTAGPLAAEEALLSDLAGHLGADDGRPRPLLVVVPSRTLREHLEARIVARRGAVLGVRAVTLFGLALELTEDLAGGSLAGGDLFPLFARRLGRGEPALARALAALDDGYGALLGPVRDLLDAGLDPALAEGLIEALATDGRTVAAAREVRRAEALVRVAGRTLEELAAAGATRRSTLLTAAAERLRREGRAALPVAAVRVYGFADASGVARDLIEALLATFGGRLYLDQPPDPAAPDRPDAGVAFTRRFRERLAARAMLGDAPGPAAPPRIEMFRAVGSDAEVREVARRVRLLLDDGARPEGIAVVARQLPPYGRAIRQHFASLALPYSAPGAVAAKSRLGRRAEALADLLERGVELAVERWLELVDRRFDERPHAELRTGFATLGIGRLREAGRLAADPYRRDHRLELPVRHGYAPAPDDQGAPRLRRRYLSAAALGEAAAAAAALVAHFEGWEEAGTLAAHRERLARLIREHLAWEEGSAGASLAADADAVWGTLAGDFALARDEFTATLCGRLRELGGQMLGGSGGGVQVLDVVAARALTCEHLFLVGLNRGVFPRLVTEDPLLPDSLRGVLSRQGFGVLPDLPDKLAGFDEERFLFAQLLASSPHVTLSWQDTDDEQMPLAPSPLVERLRWVSDDASWRAPELARPAVAQRAAVPRDPVESAVVVALAGGRARLAEVLPLVATAGRVPAARLAAARMAVLDELDPTFDNARGRAARDRLGPYYGFLGAARPGDPRFAPELWITQIEQLSGCPWQLVLRRLLGLEAAPDALAALPGITPLLIGGLVHDVLEAIVLRALEDPPAELAAARQRIPRPVPWPASEELDALVYRAAERLCRRQGIAVEGFARVLARAVGPHLEMARRLDWTAAGGPHLLGAEVGGAVEVRDAVGRERAVRFRADRVDLDASGLLLTDYKTGGRIVSTSKQDKARRANLLASVASGERLQAVAYARAAGRAGDAGRYLFLGPEVTDDATLRDVRVAADDDELGAAFERAVGAALATWDLGGFFPRLVRPDRDEEPKRCEYCEVRDACLRGDSGARRRLVAWTARLDQRFAAEGALEPHELALLTLWRLPAGGGE